MNESIKLLIKYGFKPYNADKFHYNISFPHKLLGIVSIYTYEDKFINLEVLGSTVSQMVLTESNIKLFINFAKGEKI